MLQKSLLLLMLNVSSLLVSAQEQERIKLNGLVKSTNEDLEDIYIINLKTEKQTITDVDGKFSLMLKVGDSLLFSYYKCEPERKVVTLDNFKGLPFFYKKTPIITELDEVVINQYKNINAVDLGIVKAGIKSYTPAERRLKTASASVVDGLVNTLSGRKKMLKQELEVEKKELAIQALENYVSREFIVKTLQIDSIYIKGFQFYVAENPRFRTVMASKNKTEIEFLLVQLSKTYKEVISNQISAKKN
jgi:hypothetical protein